MADERVEAAAKALWNATLPGIAWDELREASRKPIRVQARAALAAADAVAKHKPLNMPADRSAMIEKALNANDGSCSTGMLAANGEAEYWALRSALATIAYENLGTIGLNDAEKVAAFKRLAADSISADAVGRERVVLYNGPACGFVTVIDDWMRRTFTEVGPRQITIEVRGEELFVRKVRGT